MFSIDKWTINTRKDLKKMNILEAEIPAGI